MYEAQAESRRSSRSVSTDVVEAVAAHLDEDPTRLPLLQEHVDTEALGMLFQDRPSGARRSGTISFRYHGCRVLITCGEATTIHVDS